MIPRITIQDDHGLREPTGIVAEMMNQLDAVRRLIPQSGCGKVELHYKDGRVRAHVRPVLTVDDA